jgi:hypothetical protein
MSSTGQQHSGQQHYAWQGLSVSSTTGVNISKKKNQVSEGVDQSIRRDAGIKMTYVEATE